MSCETVTIPAGTTLNISRPMDMTEIENKHISLQGTVLFSPNIPYWSTHGFFFEFQNQSTFWMLGGQNILLDGTGILDGAGQAWYDAFASNNSLQRPVMLTVYHAKNVTVRNITMLNAPEWFNFVNEAEGVTYDNVILNATSVSDNSAKNTDGWDTYRSNDIVIQNSVINNGDDCVSFKPNSTNVLVSNLHCNGSHGISVGSLGQYPGEYDIVENVTATNVRMANAENGARIKAFAGEGVGSGIVRNVTFKGFYEEHVDSPVVIDQCYFTDAEACSEYPSNTYIQDIVFTNISGTSSGAEKAVVASLDCSPDGRCSGIAVNDLYISAPAEYGTAVYSCENTNLTGNAVGLFGNCSTTGVGSM